MLQRFERFNIVGEEVCVIRQTSVDDDVSKRRKVTEDHVAILDSHCLPPDRLHIMFDNTNKDAYT
jgi:hypothetical protein